ncbi:Hypothetical predicted protein [Paramuricea clavata]|uniref:Uncharacterized protein n=1 Tax=Paramuricea clavata TaxID=317549 RepID=A0A7D9HZA0_PARCT|nr:Hypothetical predicted protein [Paramuricea clavata]
MIQVVFAVSFLLVNAIGINAGTNFEVTWKKNCGYNQYVWHVSSVHSNPHQDRSWTFLCKYSSRVTTTCSWTGWVNLFTRELLYQCPNGVIAGVYSYHSNKYEDRRFSFKCCSTKYGYGYACYWTGYVNYSDGYLNYGVPTGYFLTGVKGDYDQKKKDRRWRFQYCKRA